MVHHVHSSLSYHRLVSTLSWIDDLCSLSGFPSFGPSLLKARESNYLLLIHEKNRLFKAVVTPQANPSLLKGNTCFRNSYFGGFPSAEGMETKIILVKSAEV